MASTTSNSTKQAAVDAGSQPPANYNMSYGPGNNPNMTGFNTMPISYAYDMGKFPQYPRNTTVMVGQPIIIGSPEGPNTNCALVMSTLNAIFCSVCFGTLGIILAWKARLQVLDKKIDHARHSINIVWLFIFLGLVIGILTWIAFGILVTCYDVI